MADEQEAPQQAPQPTSVQFGANATQTPQPDAAPQQAPPVNAQEVIARQQAETQRQIQEAQARDRAQFGEAVPGAGDTLAAPLGGALIQGAPPPVQGQAQPQAQPQAAPQQPAPAQQFIGSIPQGLTSQQVAAGLNPEQQRIAALQDELRNLQQQGQPQTAQPIPPQQIQQQSSQQQIIQQVAPRAVQQQTPAPQQFSQHGPQKAPNKPVIRWHPGRNSSLQIELSEVIIAGIPDDIKGEPDPQAKIVAALFSEILSLRGRIEQLEGGAGAPASVPPDIERRIGMLEMTLMQQTQALTQGARAAREEAIRQVMAEQQETAGQPGGVPVVDPTKQPQPQIEAQPAGPAGPAGPTGAAGSTQAAVGANGPAGPGPTG